MPPVENITIVQGQFMVSRKPETILRTVLGSCIAVCINDPKMRIGGMNHFLLPGHGYSERSRHDPRFGGTLMRLLVDELLKYGARREHMQAQLFGGADMHGVAGHIGAMNAIFAQTFLELEGVRTVGQCIGGRAARSLEFTPSNGYARQRHRH